MKRKILTALLIALCVFVSLAFASCGDEEETNSTDINDILNGLGGNIVLTPGSGGNIVFTPDSTGPYRLNSDSASYTFTGYGVEKSGHFVIPDDNKYITYK